MWKRIVKNPAALAPFTMKSVTITQTHDNVPRLRVTFDTPSGPYETIVDGIEMLADIKVCSRTDAEDILGEQTNRMLQSYFFPETTPVYRKVLHRDTPGEFHYELVGLPDGSDKFVKDRFGCYYVYSRTESIEEQQARLHVSHTDPS